MTARSAMAMASSSTTGSTVDVDEESSGCLTDVIMSICWLHDKFAAAYYDVQSRQMFVLPDISESYGDFTLLRQAFSQVAPTKVIISNKMPKFYTDLMKSWCSAPTENADAIDGTVPTLYIRPNQDFFLEGAKKAIRIYLPDVVHDADNLEKRMRAKFLVDFSNTMMVQSLGGLLKYLTTTQRVTEYGPDGRMILSAIRSFAVMAGMLVDSNTLVSLQIFRSDFNPKSVTVEKRNKTVQCVFDLLSRCRTAMGNIQMRRWMLRPLSDKNLLQDRLDAVEFFSRDTSMDLVASLVKLLNGVKKISGILCRMQFSVVPLIDWVVLYETISATNGIQRLLQSYAGRVPLLSEMGAINYEELQNLLTLIEQVIDLEQLSTDTRDEDRFIVKPGVSAKLDSKRGVSEEMVPILNLVGSSLLQLLPHEIQHLSVTYEPLIGYLVEIPITQTWGRSAGDVHHIPGLEFALSTVTHHYFRCVGTQNLNRLLGDVHAERRDLESGMRQKLQMIVLEFSPQLLDVSGIAAELDCLIVLGHTARELNLVKPTLLDENLILIEDGRNILTTERSGHSMIPNPVVSGDTQSRVHILTGPNSSGKTVYLKEVGVLVYLAHVGCFLPAKSASLGVFDHIYTRLYTVDSVSEGLSSFAVDVGQVSTAVSESGPHSLVILDEFGKGALTEVGMPLLTSTLNYWASLSDDCPHVYASTHFHDIPRLFGEDSRVDFLTMECIEQNSDLVFLHRLVHGVIDKSFGIHAAQKGNIPQNVISRSYEVFEVGGKLSKLSVSSESRRVEQQWYTRVVSLIDVECDLDNVDMFKVIEKLMQMSGGPSSQGLNGANEVSSTQNKPE